MGNTRSPASGSSESAVHPHACGEHRSGCTCSGCYCGSSPRMWGTHRSGNLTYLNYRFIPTHVGNTVTASTSLIIVAVHPHACGEHCDSFNFAHNSCGSSPRMWGTRLRLRFVRVPYRFIPTHVGNTLSG